jgi:hypothetical protein
VPEAPKLCPLSFGFSIKQQAPSLIDTRRVDVRIQIGIPCIKEKCNWWSLKIGACVIWLITSTLIELISKPTEVA